MYPFCHPGHPDVLGRSKLTCRAQDRLGREVNTTIRKSEQWHGTQDRFARQLRSSPLVQIPLPASDRYHGQGMRCHGPVVQGGSSSGIAEGVISGTGRAMQPARITKRVGGPWQT